MAELQTVLQDYVATANDPALGGNWHIIDSKFPELANYDKEVLRDYVATVNDMDYDWDAVNAKFPEFFPKSYKKKNHRKETTSKEEILEGPTKTTDSEFKYGNPGFSISQYIDNTDFYRYPGSDEIFYKKDGKEYLYEQPEGLIPGLGGHIRTNDKGQVFVEGSLISGDKEVKLVHEKYPYKTEVVEPGKNESNNPLLIEKKINNKGLSKEDKLKEIEKARKEAMKDFPNVKEIIKRLGNGKQLKKALIQGMGTYGFDFQFHQRGLKKSKVTIQASQAMRDKYPEMKGTITITPGAEYITVDGKSVKQGEYVDEWMKKMADPKDSEFESMKDNLLNVEGKSDTDINDSYFLELEENKLRNQDWDVDGYKPEGEHKYNDKKELLAKHTGIYALDEDGYLREKLKDGKFGNFIFDERLEGREDGIKEAAAAASTEDKKFDVIIPKEEDWANIKKFDDNLKHTNDGLGLESDSDLEESLSKPVVESKSTPNEKLFNDSKTSAHVAHTLRKVAGELDIDFKEDKYAQPRLEKQIREAYANGEAKTEDEALNEAINKFLIKNTDDIRELKLSNEYDRIEKETEINFKRAIKEDGLYENVVEYVKELHGGAFYKSKQQKQIYKQIEEEHGEIRKEVKDFISAADLVSSNIDKLSTSLTTKMKDLEDLEKTTIDRIKEIQSGTYTSQDEVDDARDEIEDLQDTYNQAYNNFKMVAKEANAQYNVALRIQDEIDNLSLKESEIAAFAQAFGQNHQLGSKMTVGWVNGWIDLVQGIETELHKVWEYVNPFGKITDWAVDLDDPNIDPGVKSFVEGARMMTGLEKNYWDVVNESRRDKIHAAIDGFQNRKLTDKVGKSVQYKDIKSFGDFGEWFGVMLSGQLPNLTLMASTGGASLYVMGASSAGQKYKTMEDSKRLFIESGGLYGHDYGFENMFINSTLTGVAEALSEKVTLGQMKSLKGALANNPAAKLGFKNFLKKNVFSYDNLKYYGGQFFQEGGSEALATISENVFDIVSKGESFKGDGEFGLNRGLYEGIGESFVSGVLISSTIHMPMIFKDAIAPFQRTGNNQKIGENTARIKELQDLLLNKDVNSKTKASFETEIAKLVAKNTEMLQSDIKGVDSLNNQQKSDLLDIESENHQYRKDAENISKDTALTKEEQQKQIQELQTKVDQNLARKDAILGQLSTDVIETNYRRIDATVKKNIKEAEKAGVKINVKRGKDRDFKDFLYQNEADNLEVKGADGKTTSMTKDAWVDGMIGGYQQVLNDPNATKEQKRIAREDIRAFNQYKKDRFSIVKGQAKGYGVMAPIIKNGEFTGEWNMFLNEDKIMKDGRVATSAHEFLHGALFATLQGNTDAQMSLGNSLLNELHLGIQAGYIKVKPNSKYDLNANAYSVEEGKGEEVLMASAEAMIDGDITFHDGVFTKIGDAFRRFGQQYLGVPIRFNNSRQVYNFVKDYANTINKGKTVNKAFLKMMQKGAKGRLIRRAKKGKIPTLKFSKSASKFDTSQKLTIDRFAVNDDGSRMTKEQWNREGVVKAYGQMMEGKILDGLIVKGLEIDKNNPNVYGKPLDNFIEDVKGDLIGTLMRFNPEINDSLSGWINNQINFRKGDILKKYKKDAGTVSTDVGIMSTAGNLIGAQIEADIDEGVERFEEEDISYREGRKPTKDEPTLINLVKLDKAGIGKIMSIIEASNIKLQDPISGKVKDYKAFKKLVLGKDAPLKGVLEVISKEFGVPINKIIENKDLTTAERKAAQEYIKEKGQVLRDHALPEGHTASGKATGVQPTLLKQFYIKGDRVKMSKTGSKQGLPSQTKKDNIPMNDFKAVFGINPDGTPVNNKKFDGTIRSLIVQTGVITANQSARLNAINKETDPLNIIALVGDGKSAMAFSKKSDNRSLNKIGSLTQKAILKKKDEDIFYGRLHEISDNLAVSGYNVAATEGVIRRVFKDLPANSSILKNANIIAQSISNTVKGYAPIKAKEKLINPNKRQEGLRETIFEALLRNNKDNNTKIASFFGGGVQTSSLMNPPSKKNKKIERVRAGELEHLIIKASKIRKKHKGDNARIGQEIFKLIQQHQGHNATAGKIGGRRNQNYNGNKSYYETMLSVDPRLNYKVVRRGKTGFTVDPGSITYDGTKISKPAGYSSQLGLPLAQDYQLKIKGDNTNINKRLNEVKEAQDATNDYIKFWVNKFEKGEANLADLQIVAANLLSNMNPMLARAGIPTYLAKNLIPKNFANMTKGEYATWVKNNHGKIVYEHMIPRVNLVIGLFNAHLFGNGDADVKKIFKNYTVAGIADNFDKVLKKVKLNQALTSGQTLFSPSFMRYFNDLTMLFGEIQSLVDVNTNETLDRSDSYKKVNDILAEQGSEINGFEKQSNMFSKSLPLTKGTKGISILDFDDTLATTKSLVKFTKPDGTTGTLNAEQYANNYQDLLAEGYKFDFSDFSKVIDAKLAPLFNKALKLQSKFGPKNMFVLTARPANSARAIRDFLKANGLNIPLKNITGLGNSTAEAKATWVADKVIDGYNDFYFADDALQNVTAVKSILDQFDVKSKVQQAKMNFSKQGSKTFSNILNEGSSDLDSDFNIMIEETTKGKIKRDKECSGVTAKQRGSKKGRFKFFIPPSAEDFAGLCYSFFGKGKQGEQHHKFFKEKLFDPFAKGIRALNLAKQSVADDVRRLKKAMPDVRKLLRKKIPGTEYSYESAARVYLWNKAGHDIPGLSQADKAKLIETVENNPNLQAYADGINSVSSKVMGYPQPDINWILGNMSMDLNEASQRSRAEFLAEWTENKNIIFSEKNLNKIEATFGTNFKEALMDSLWRMENGTNRRYGNNKMVNNFMDWINGSIGTTMFINIRSAVLQTLSTVNFINWHDNNPLKAAAAFGNLPQFTKDFVMIFNSNWLRQRRTGLQHDVNANEMMKSIQNAKSPIKAAIGYLLQKGFKPTQIMDSFAISSGGATFYRNRVKSYIKQGLNKKAAEDRAFIDMQEIAEETQQSSRPDRISQQQASVLGKLILAFQNTPMQYMRLTKKAFRDLVNGRGDPKTHLSKIIYYSTVQNIIFYSLQSALFSLLFNDDEDDDQDIAHKKKIRTINGMMDSILRGTGIGGAVVSTIKNMIIKFVEQEKKGYYADHAYTLIEGLNLSPPIGIKARKLYSATQTWEFNRDVIKHMSKTDIDNPMYSAMFSLIEATTNVPLSRAYNKMKNVREALDDDNEMWQRVALLMGWNRWDLGVQDDKIMDIKNEISEIKKIEKKKKKEEAKIEKKKKVEEENKILEQEFIKQQNKEKKEGKEDVTCVAVNKSGNRCGMKIVGEGKYCTIHQKVEKREDNKKVQCSKIKSDDKRCKMQTNNKSGLCYYHD